MEFSGIKSRLFATYKKLCGIKKNSNFYGLFSKFIFVRFFCDFLVEKSISLLHEIHINFHFLFRHQLSSLSPPFIHVISHFVLFSHIHTYIPSSPLHLYHLSFIDFHIFLLNSLIYLKLSILSLSLLFFVRSLSLTQIKLLFFTSSNFYKNM